MCLSSRSFLPTAARLCAQWNMAAMRGCVLFFPGTFHRDIRI
ncbi:hypothetical protein EHW99_0204 [Erwinia amylovora]|nr:hypothetical protein EHX00_0204 [Erwinia amylovora]QJQ56609.1 hypothetical protein EHW99_0204 [Erwinia amylovora]QJQ60308.1 hypothetical protein EHW98_0204 [Erwinia amylovora]QJQ64110.1 hypothetical protein EHW96_0204 [Erwinia amylovora]QJQ67809.1 hypothetical protein EGZ89_0204 [Erwinia amylovora]